MKDKFNDEVQRVFAYVTRRNPVILHVPAGNPKDLEKRKESRRQKILNTCKKLIMTRLAYDMIIKIIMSTEKGSFDHEVLLHIEKCLNRYGIDLRKDLMIIREDEDDER